MHDVSVLITKIGDKHIRVILLNLTKKNVTYFPSIGLKLTGACRFKCPFCCEPDKKQVIYPVENFISIAKTLKQYGTQRLCFTGGDPLLYPEIIDLLRYTKSIGFYNLLLTSDGALLETQYKKLLPYVDAIRFSIHAIGKDHDKIVNRSGAFNSVKNMIDILTINNIPCYIATVVNPINQDYILDIAEWCANNNVKRHYLFGLMRSGNGDSFIKEMGEVSEQFIDKILSEIETDLSLKKMDTIYYDFKNKAECILIYGNGEIIADPYPIMPNFQLKIGNIFSNSMAEIINTFSQDPKNNDGYYKHLHKQQVQFLPDQVNRLKILNKSQKNTP